MCQYRCKEAISCLKDLPDYHYETGWVLSLIGRAHLELAEYPAVNIISFILLLKNFYLFYFLKNYLG